MTRVSTRGRWLWILVALITASAVLIAIGGSEASANPEGKTYTATIAPSEATAGVLDTYALTVTNTSDSTPLGAVNLGTIPEIVSDGSGQCSPEVTDPVFEFAGIPEEPDPIWAGDGGTKAWMVQWDKDNYRIELRAVDSSDRLDFGESVSIYVDLTVLQKSIASEECVDFALSIAAKQANTFNAEQGNDLTFVPEPGKSSIGPELRVWHVAQRCTTGPENCTLSQGFGDDTGAIFTLSGTCNIPGDEGCGIVSIELVSDAATLGASGKVAYSPAGESTEVRAFLTLPKEVLTKSASRYTFDLLELDEYGNPILDENDIPILKEADLDKCRRDETNCIEDIVRTKTDVTWIFRVDPVDPRLDWK